MVATREGWISKRDGGYEKGMDKYKRWWQREMVAAREGWISTRDSGYERGMDKYKR